MQNCSRKYVMHPAIDSKCNKSQIIDLDLIKRPFSSLTPHVSSNFSGTCAPCIVLGCIKNLPSASNQIVSRYATIGVFLATTGQHIGFLVNSTWRIMVEVPVQLVDSKMQNHVKWCRLSDENLNFFKLLFLLCCNRLLSEVYACHLWIHYSLLTAQYWNTGNILFWRVKWSICSW